MKKGKVTIISGNYLQDLLDRMEDITRKQEEKENRSIARIALDILKKPVIGKHK